jgi:Rieske Fe-S protein
MLLPDLIQGLPHPWATLYDPSRTTLRAVPGQLAHDVAINLFYADYVRPSDVHDIEEIPRCGGAVVRHGLRRVAVYRDADGKVHQRSAVCPHLGGVVRWNAAEQSWDCPVYASHGERPHRHPQPHACLILVRGRRTGMDRAFRVRVRQ